MTEDPNDDTLGGVKGQNLISEIASDLETTEDIVFWFPNRVAGANAHMTWFVSIRDFALLLVVALSGIVPPARVGTA
jgi:hypothetical protein